MASYMTQQLFNMCAVSAAKFSAEHQKPIDAVAYYVAQQYENDFLDEHLADEIATATTYIINYLRSAGYENSLIGQLIQMEFCIRHYEPDGKKRSTRIFGGTFFNKERAPLQDKAKNCASQILAYNLRVIGGSIPAAPPGWSL